MSFVLDFLKLRRPMLNYVSPPICEVIFSSTGVVIILEPINPLGAPSGLALGGVGGHRLVWNVFPVAICYNVYESVDANDPFGPYVLVSECQPDPEYPNPQPRCYRVSAITLDGESSLSDPFCITTAAPTVETEPATDVTATDAILNGIVNPNGFSCSAYFQWGLDLSYGNQTAPQAVGNGIIDLNFDDLIESLTQNTTYHFRAVATNGEFIITGSDEQFTTPGGGGDPCDNPPSWTATDNTVMTTVVLPSVALNPFPISSWPSLGALPVGQYTVRYTDGAVKRRAVGRPFFAPDCPTALATEFVSYPDAVCAFNNAAAERVYVWQFFANDLFFAFLQGRGTPTANLISNSGVDMVGFPSPDSYPFFVSTRIADGEVTGILHGGGIARRGNLFNATQTDANPDLPGELHTTAPTYDIIRTRQFFMTSTLPVTVLNWAAVSAALITTPGVILQDSVQPAFTGVFNYGTLVYSTTPGEFNGYIIDEFDPNPFAFSVNGKTLLYASLVFDSALCNRWALSFIGKNDLDEDVVLWEGIKFGFDYHGVYVFNSGAAIGLAFVEI